MSDPSRPLADITAVERRYLDLIRRHGHPAPVAKRVDLQPLIVDDGETDCWTHAWTLAQRLGGAYVEGTCIRPGAGGPSMHAWVEADTPFGRQVIETTSGYERATGYRGLVVDCTSGGQVDLATAHAFEAEPRSSVLQLALAVGWGFEETLAWVRPR